MKTIVLLIAAALLLSGCETRSYPKDDAQAAQYAADERACRSQVRDAAQKQRNIEDQRRATFEGERERYGQQDLYKTMANQGYTNDFDRLLRRCMEARGWTPKRKSPFPDLTW